MFSCFHTSVAMCKRSLLGCPQPGSQFLHYKTRCTERTYWVDAFCQKNLAPVFCAQSHPGSISEPREHYVFFFACVWTLRFGGCRPKWPLRFLRNALADTPLHSAESHQLCREPARTEGEDSSNNMATTAVSPQSLPHLQSCYGFPDSL